jgi:hypothetical protein
LYPISPSCASRWLLWPAIPQQNKATGDSECDKVQHDSASERFYPEERSKSFGQHSQGSNHLSYHDNDDSRRNEEDQSTNDRRFDETQPIIHMCLSGLRVGLPRNQSVLASSSAFS